MGMILWDSRTWTPQQTITVKPSKTSGDSQNEVKRVAFSLDGKYLAGACSQGSVQVYDLSGASATFAAELGGHTDCTFDVSWGVCPKTRNNILVSASHDKTCRYWMEMNS